MKKKRGNGGIKQKMMRGIVPPTIAILIIVAIVILLITRAAVDDIRQSEITAQSKQVSNQISEYFTKYMETTRQLAANNELQMLFEGVTDGEEIAKEELFGTVIKTMTNVRHTDEENILVCWIADVDSSQCVEDGDSGYISPIGEWDITGRSWYSQVVAAGKTIVTEPYENSSTGQMVASVISPVYDGNNALMGVAAVDVSVDTLSVMMSGHQLGKSGFFMLLTPQGNIMYAPDTSLVNTAVADSGMDQNVLDAFSENAEKELTYRWDGTKQYGSLSMIGESGWLVLSGMPSQEYNQVIYRIFGVVGGFFLAAIVILILLINGIATGIVKPLKKLEEAAEEIAGIKSEI